jgi:glycine cleavage system H lipoate-binding protein
MIMNSMRSIAHTYVRYTMTHEYIVVANGLAKIGFTHHIRHLLRPVVFVEMYANIGDNVKRDNLLLRIETPRLFKEMVMPVDGKVTCINTAYNCLYSARHSNEQKADWLIEFQVDHCTKQFNMLMTLDEYTRYLTTLP